MKENWIYKKFGEVFNLQMGKTPSRDNLAFWGGENIWVSIADLKGKYIDSTKEHITDVAVRESGINKIPKGTAIMSFKLTIGRTAITKCDLFTNEAIMSFEPKENGVVLADYVYYYLNGCKWTGANKAVKGQTLNKKTISENTFAYPPIDTQSRIVSELDLLQSIIDKQKAQLKELDNLAQAIFYDMFGDPVENEKGWEVKKYGDEFKIGAGGTPSKSVSEYWEDGTIPWIGSNMCQNKVIYQTDGKFITQEGLSHSSAKILEKGTVIVALVGATIGKVGLLKTETSTNQNVAYINVSENKSYNSYFVYYQLQKLYELFMAIGNGEFKMANQGFIKALPIIKPPLSLQQSFAQKVEAIERQKELINQSINEVQTLFDSQMEYYFG